MKFSRILPVTILAAALAGCAGSISAPTAVQPLSADQKASLHVSTITADAASGVEMSDGDFGLITQQIRNYIQNEAPGVLADNGLKMQVHFTRFDRGNAFARFMLIGLGQIRIDADVLLQDATGATVAKYKVSKDFALGGVAGGMTTVEDVEEGFAKSVAEVVKTKV